MEFTHTLTRSRALIGRGFTLIELLVVVAIIGVLSAITMALLTAPSAKGADAAVKANLRTVVTQAYAFFETYNKYNTNGSSGLATQTTCPTAGTSNTMFDTDPVIKNAIAAANTAGGGPVKCYMNAQGTQYVVWAAMKTAGTYWCIDQNNSGKQENTPQGPLHTSCP
ncbi:MAG: hypothetical protein JWN18_286 [Parcubacteria group bacterium]|nr:hypothetical protein [Parcubacteria group bacterium]